MDRRIKKAFDKLINEKHKIFDKKEHMLVNYFEGKGYHTALKSGEVHSIRDSIEYGVALLYCNDNMYKTRGMDIIEKIVSLQDTCESSKTYGIWPYTLEEPLHMMDTPDWNWADFISKVLIYVIEDHSDMIPKLLLERVKEAIYHAAKSIIRRNMGPDYTNISLMGAYVTVKAGETLNNEEFFNYGKKRLSKALKYNKENGGFSEYNSPTYTITALEEIGRMLKYFRDEKLIKIAVELNDIAWRCLANHFHPTTRQLSAPHGRCYDDIQDSKVLVFVNIGICGKLKLDEEAIDFDLMWPFMKISCPEKYHNLFVDIDSTRRVEEIFYKGKDYISDDEIRVNIEKGMPELKATTFMNKNFSIGSFARYDLWNQRRPLMAYWGSNEKPSYFRLRCLHDGKDFCGAIINNHQVKNNIISGVSFVKDHGDFHFILDPLEEGKIKAKNITLRFEIGGYINNVNVIESIKADEFNVIADNIKINILPMYYSFGAYPVKIQVDKNEENIWLDFILYEGEERYIDFNQLENCAFVFALNIDDGSDDIDERPCFEYEIDKINESISASMISSEQKYTITVPSKPGVYIEKPSDKVRKVKCGGYIYE